MNTNSTKQWALGTTEVGYNVEVTSRTDGHTSDMNWKIYSPKILPLVPMGTTRDTTVRLSSTIFSNEASCRPSIQSTIKSRNYITLSRAGYSFARPYKNHGMRVELYVINGNIDNIRLTNHIDNSYNIDWE